MTALPPKAGIRQRGGPSAWSRYRTRHTFLPVAPEILPRFDQLDPVAERIVDVPPVAAFDGLIFGHFVAGMFQLGLEIGKVVDNKCRMSLARRHDILVDTEMHR